MGNACEVDLQCLQVSPRNAFRTRSQTEPISHTIPKNFIQIKYQELSSEYSIKGLLGKGSFGYVYRVVNRQTKVVRAVKRIQKNKDTIDNLQQFAILKKLDHPNIIRIYDIFSQSKYLSIVMDLCEGGQMFDRIIKQGNITQNTAKLYMKQLLSAIHYCHSNKIVHRDLKPQNIMFQQKDGQDLKIIDFGVGTSFRSDIKLKLKVGSIYYMAPQVINKKYNNLCDVWSLGVILYVLLTGKQPFSGQTDKDVYKSIIKGQVPFPMKKWKKISPKAKDLVQKMLTYDPQKRITAWQALKHPWIIQHSQSGEEKLYFQSQMSSIKHFCRMNSFQSALMVYISHNFLQKEMLYQLQQKFKAIDMNGDGRISRKQFLDCYKEHMPPQPQSQILSIFANLDKNKSGYIDYTEFMTSTISSNRIVNQQLVEKAFQIIDKDDNGKLSQQELKEAFGGCNGDVVDQIMSEFDLNKDGFISKMQFKIAMKGLFQK